MEENESMYDPTLRTPEQLKVDNHHAQLLGVLQQYFTSEVMSNLSEQDYENLSFYHIIEIDIYNPKVVEDLDFYSKHIGDLEPLQDSLNDLYLIARYSFELNPNPDFDPNVSASDYFAGPAPYIFSICAYSEHMKGEKDARGNIEDLAEIIQLHGEREFRDVINMLEGTPNPVSSFLPV